MITHRHPAIPAALLAAVLIGQGCQAPPIPNAGAGAAAAMPEDPRRPLNDMKEARFQAAVAGLDFDTGRVVVTEPLPGANHRVAIRHRSDGLDKLTTNRRTGALASMTLAVRADPQWAVAYNDLGEVLRTKGRIEHEAAAYRTAIELDPKFVDARYNLAVALASLGRRNEAIEQMRSVVDLAPDHARAHERLAIWSYYAGDNDAAWAHVRAAEDLGHTLPPQFLALLESRLPSP